MCVTATYYAVACETLRTIDRFLVKWRQFVIMLLRFVFD
jgi:hypothetical protein